MSSHALICSRKAVAFTKVRYPSSGVDNLDEEHEAFPDGADVELLNQWFERMAHFQDRHIHHEKDYRE